MGELTKAQVDALAAMDSWRKGVWLPTTSLNADGVSTATLRSLYVLDLIDAKQTRGGKFWRLLDAGRAALSAINEGKKP